MKRPSNDQFVVYAFVVVYALFLAGVILYAELTS